MFQDFPLHKDALEFLTSSFLQFDDASVFALRRLRFTCLNSSPLLSFFYTVSKKMTSQSFSRKPLKTNPIHPNSRSQSYLIPYFKTSTVSIYYLLGKLLQFQIKRVIYLNVRFNYGVIFGHVLYAFLE